jgi:hypothetical protein
MFVDINGKMRAHPDTEPAGSATLRVSDHGQQVPLGTELLPRDYNAFLGTELLTVTTAETLRFISDYFTLRHCSLLQYWPLNP